MSSSFIGELGPFQKTNRSAYLNFLRAKYEMYTGEVLVKSYPYYLTIEPSDLCQLRCPTCVTGIENESRRGTTAEKIIFRKNRSMMTSEFLDALLAELGEYLFLIVFYNFGEPLLNKNLPNLIRKAKALNIETDINTNLALPLSDEYIENLLSSGLDYLYASIDGFSQETYQIHRVGGNLELVKKNLERLAKARDKLGLKTSITYNFLVFSFNEHEIPAAKRYCNDLGINFNTREAFIHNPDWLPSYRKNEKPYIVPKEVALPTEFSYRKNGKTLAWSPFPEPQETKPPSSCAWHYGYSVVTARGLVAPCCAVPKEEADFGRVVPEGVSFADVWNNDLYRKSRAAFAGKEISGLDKVEPVCTRCPAPRFMYHLYSLHDFKVMEQFKRIFGGSDPLLEQAFNLFGKVCHGLNPLQILMGEGREKDTAKFVDFFEQKLIHEFSAARPETPGGLVSLKTT